MALLIITLEVSFTWKRRKEVEDALKCSTQHCKTLFKTKETVAQSFASHIITNLLNRTSASRCNLADWTDNVTLGDNNLAKLVSYLQTNPLQIWKITLTQERSGHIFVSDATRRRLTSLRVRINHSNITPLCIE